MKTILLAIAMYIVAAIFYFYEFLLRVLPSALYSDLRLEFQIDATQIGFLSSLYFWPYALLQLPAGIWIDKLGPRRLLTGAIFACAVSTLLFGHTESYLMACVARIFIGAGSAFAFISCMKIVALWFAPKRFAFFAGLTLMIGSLGAVAGESPVAYLLHLMTWRELMNWLGWAGVILSILAYVFVRDDNTSIRQIEQIEVDHNPCLGFWTCLRAIAKNPLNWWIAFYAFLTTAPTDAFGGMWGTPFLIDVHHFTHEQAATAASITFLGLACGSPVLSWLTDVFRSRRKPMWLGAGIATLVLMIIVFSETLAFGKAAVLFFLFGFFGAYVLSFIAARDSNPAQYIGTMVGFVNMASMIGSALLMGGIGLMLDFSHGESKDPLRYYNAHDYHLALSVVPLFYFLCVIWIIPKIRESYPKPFK